MAEEENQSHEEDFSVQEKVGTQEELDSSLVSFTEHINTHKRINKTFSGKVVALEKSYCKVAFLTTNDMRVDELGLVHSGFVFSAADYAASIAVNEQNTVIIGSKVSFLAPAKVGDLVEIEARVKFEDLRKREIEVEGKINEIKVFQGTFHAVILEKHIFKTKIKNVKRTY